jgi:hypothetical protein
VNAPKPIFVPNHHHHHHHPIIIIIMSTPHPLQLVFLSFLRSLDFIVKRSKNTMSLKDNFERICLRIHPTDEYRVAENIYFLKRGEQNENDIRYDYDTMKVSLELLKEGFHVTLTFQYCEYRNKFAHTMVIFGCGGATSYNTNIINIVAAKVVHDMNEVLS